MAHESRARNQRAPSARPSKTFSQTFNVRYVAEHSELRAAAGALAKVYTALCGRSGGKDKDGTPTQNLTLAWRSRDLLRAYDALIAQANDDEAGGLPQAKVWTWKMKKPTKRSAK